MRGVLFVVLSSIIYGIEPTIRQLIVEGGMKPVESSFLGFVFATVYSVLVCLMRKKNFRIRRAQAGMLLLIGGIGNGCCVLLLLQSYQHIPVGCATVIHFLYPTVVCVAMRIFFKTRLFFAHVLAILLSIVGLLCISTDLYSTSLTGILLAAASSLAYAFYVVGMGNSAAIRELPIETKAVYTSLGGLLVCGAAYAAAGPSHSVTALNCCALGGSVMLSTTAVFLFLAGLNRIRSTTAAFLCLFEPITSVIFSTLIFHYQFTWIMALGCVLELAAILFINMGDHLALKSASTVKG